MINSVSQQKKKVAFQTKNTHFIQEDEHYNTDLQLLKSRE